MDYELNVWISKLLQTTQSYDEEWKKEAMQIILRNIEALVKDKDIYDDKINAKTFVRDDKKEIMISVTSIYSSK